MKQINEAARSVDVIAETDILVVGSGPGGLAAAIGAARAGAETTLLERYGCFGGNITQVGVEGFAWYRHENTIDSEGVGIEFEQRAKAMGAANPEPQSDSHALNGDRDSHAAVRNMMCCTVSGQGAGVGAAVSLQSDVSPDAVDIDAVQTELQRQGVRLY